MASTTALFTGLSGLNVHSKKLDVIGNNIANVNTTGFKGSRMLFESQFFRTFSFGSAPGVGSGGTNPAQAGLGVGIGGVQRDFRTGAFAATGDSRDMAIDGTGFFIVSRNGQDFYTRAGSFRQDLNDNLVTINGEVLQGYGIDENFNIIEGTLTDMNIPVGKLTIAEATSAASLAGNLNASGDLPTAGSSIDILGDAGAGLQDTGGVLITAATLLTAIEDPANPGGGASIITAGDTIRISGVEKGTRTIPDAEFTVAAGSTVQDLMDFIDDALGIQDYGSPNPDGTTPGVAVDPATGVITITGNVGTASDINFEGADLIIDSGGTTTSPFTVTDNVEADGESVHTQVFAYNSLGARITVDATFVLDSKNTDNGTTWRYFFDSADDSTLPYDLGTGTVSFDENGRIIDSSPVTVSVDLTGTGADTPLNFELLFDSTNGELTALDDDSIVANVASDGLPAGTLQNFTVQADGLVMGGFDNGEVRQLGQVVLATFANQEGLVDTGGNSFFTGPNSGSPVITTPGTFGSGTIVGGMLEQANVDLGEEFTQMILTSTGYSASSRVIRTTDELLQQLLVLGR